jgi:dienelactone hydrolase
MSWRGSVGLRGALVAACTIAGTSVAVASAAGAFNPVVESKNYSKIEERQQIYDTPAYQAQLRTISTQNNANALAIQATDPEREFVSDLCWNQSDGCAGDTRLYDWQAKGYGIVQPVLFTARDGATLSGHVWATRAGPPKRPGIVITNGSVQADEQLYWFAAQALAKAGYVVLTWDPQGQGQSDTYGEGVDRNEGFPAQTDGRPFFDGTEDAVNFFFSNPSHPYVPESSCSTGTSHAPKQARRVKAGLDAGYNPFWALFDGKRFGLAGHSYGAAGVSYIGQWDPRVDAIVAWDNLSQPSPGQGGRSFPPGEAGCPAHPADRTDLTKNLSQNARGKPALGMSADYFLPPTPNTSQPPDQAYCDSVGNAYDAGTPPSQSDGTACKSLASKEYSKHGIDSGEIVIRGGSHLDFSFIPNQAFGATLRGADLIAWYTTAWFDKYVKRDPTADQRLLTNRWRHDVQEGSVDPDQDPNMFSFYHLSRLDFTLSNGSKVDCEDLRTGCPALTDSDGFPGDYAYATIDRSPDSPGSGGQSLGASGVRASGLARACTSRRVITVHAARIGGARIERVTAYVGGRRVGRGKAGRVRILLVGFPKRTVRVMIVIDEVRHGRVVRRRAYRTYHTCRPGRR